MGMRCAVLGDPVEHSLSPVLHRAGYDALGLDWHYEPRQVRSGHLPQFLASLGESWRGLSLTMPLKREALALVEDCSLRARLAGGVNTLVRTTYGWAGDNTDYPGAVAAVRERYDAPIRRGAVLGAGATAGSTGLALVELGARSISLLARDAVRAEESRAVIAAHPSRPEVRIEPLEARPDVDALVSTIPVAAQVAPLVAAWRDVPLLFEVVYDPWLSPLMAAATGTVVSGLDLLVHQAVLQFELFTSSPAPLAAMRAAGEAALGLAPAHPASATEPLADEGPDHTAERADLTV
ncbi:shikimate dehydrogenase [Nocardioides sp. BP30]|uniref:shikimate dehydrogenase n=1 Tax=Nocardioides sp. BP30 TaxID=3036374 RepID=UPI002469BD5F|nr:shikimate dehydrogenase [Nocardioides sp. BP30]WGL50435.1 shikimate dehydrogenase [Nocardioides sp. BP30]